MSTMKGPRGSRASEKDLITAPTDPYTVSIGSAAEHAYFVEKGSGTHRSSTGTELFIERLNIWAKQTLGISKDDKATSYRFWLLVKHIRDTGTDEKPFVEPSREYINGLARGVLDKAIAKFTRTGTA